MIAELYLFKITIYNLMLYDWGKKLVMTYRGRKSVLKNCHFIFS